MSDIFCPLCSGKKLEEHEENGNSVSYCDGCGGLWLTAGTLDKIAHPHQGSLEYSLHEHADQSAESALICPVCDGHLMEKRNFIEYSDIKIDYCNKCGGIWLEKGELDAINREIDALNEIPDTFTHKLMVFLANLPFN